MNGLSLQLTILMPVYNDWESARLVIAKLDEILAKWNADASVLVVDDCSAEPIPDSLDSQRLTHISKVEVLRLRRNLGHQRRHCHRPELSAQPTPVPHDHRHGQ